MCAPAATINSFVYLSSLTGNNNLMGGTGSWVGAIGKISGAQYMNTDATGTTVTNFIDGKVNYINLFSPNTFYFEGQTKLYGGAQNYPWLQNANPTGEYLYSMLSMGQDVEIGIWPSGTYENYIGHMLTLTGVSWNDANNNNIYDGADTFFISVIDPNLGVFKPNIQVFLNNNVMWFSYNGNPYDIRLDVAESTVPEPSTCALLCLGLGLLGYARKRMSQKEQ
jgi:hypothetical protein